MVSIIVVSYNSLDYLVMTLNSLIEKTNYPCELIVIDNSSDNQTRDYLKKKTEDYKSMIDFKLMLNKENKGYSQACNQGIKMADGKYICLMNNDLILSKNWLERLLVHLENNPSAGMVGPLGKGIGGEQNYVGIYRQLAYRYPEKGELDKFSDYLYKNFKGDYTETKFLIGCCLLLKREVIEKVGLLDEGFFMSADDFDYSLRTRIAGFSLYVAEDVIVHHYCHQSFASLMPPQEEEMFRQAWSYFNNKWQGLLKFYSMDDLFYNKRKVFYRGLIKGHRLKIAGY